MAKRPAYTLLFIKSDLLVRADFGPLPRAELLGFWQQPQSGNVRLYYAIDASIKLSGNKIGREVWVIGEEFWTQTLSLPASAVSGLGHEQIAKTIGFDVEALTGIAGSDAVLGFTEAVPPDESAHFWVTQIATAARGQIQKTIETAGGALAGLVHPGGLPEPVNPNARSDGEFKSWRRIEVWKDTTLCITGQPGQSRRITVINGDPTQDAWNPSVTQWMNATHADVSEWLGPQGSMAGESLVGADHAWTQVPELKGDVLKDWLTRWMSELGNGAKHVPTIATSRRVGFTQKHITTAAAMACICLACCVGHGMWLTHQEKTAVADRDAVVAPKREMDELKNKAGRLQTELAKARAANDRAYRPTAGDPADVERQRPRIEGLLTALASGADANVVIDHVAMESAGVVLIEGKCLTSTSIDDFARRLAARLSAGGWEITPAQKLIPEGGSVGGPCEFRLRARPEFGRGAPDAVPTLSAARNGGAG